MSDLSSASREELRAELERRAKAAAIPVPRARSFVDVDWASIYKTATDAVNDAIERNFMDKDAEGYVWEAVLEAIYGGEYWTWRRALMGGSNGMAPDTLARAHQPTQENTPGTADLQTDRPRQGAATTK